MENIFEIIHGIAQAYPRNDGDRDTLSLNVIAHENGVCVPEYANVYVPSNCNRSLP